MKVVLSKKEIIMPAVEQYNILFDSCSADSLN